MMKRHASLTPVWLIVKHSEELYEFLLYREELNHSNQYINRNVCEKYMHKTTIHKSFNSDENDQINETSKNFQVFEKKANSELKFNIR